MGSKFTGTDIITGSDQIGPDCWPCIAAISSFMEKYPFAVCKYPVDPDQTLRFRVGFGSALFANVPFMGHCI